MGPDITISLITRIISTSVLGVILIDLISTVSPALYILALYHYCYTPAICTALFI